MCVCVFDCVCLCVCNVASQTIYKTACGGETVLVHLRADRGVSWQRAMQLYTESREAGREVRPVAAPSL